MIETTVADIRKQEVQFALGKIKQCTGFDPGYGYQIGIVVKELEQQFTKFEQEAYQKYAELAERDENSNPKTEEHEFRGMKYTRYVFSEENGKIADEVAKTTGENKIILANRPKLHLSKLIGAKLNPVELISIDFMLDDTK